MSTFLSKHCGIFKQNDTMNVYEKCLCNSMKGYLLKLSVLRRVLQRICLLLFKCKTMTLRNPFSKPENGEKVTMIQGTKIN